LQLARVQFGTGIRQQAGQVLAGHAFIQRLLQSLLAQAEFAQQLSRQARLQALLAEAGHEVQFALAKVVQVQRDADAVTAGC
jgi:hypothetical protein